MNQLNPSNYFENTGGGVGAPSAKLSAVDDFVFGEILDQAMVPLNKFGTNPPVQETDSRTGEKLFQLLVVVQTDFRNWQNVAKIPTNEQGQQKAASEDDGRRAIYVPAFSNIHAAIGEATEKKPLANGGTLGVKVIELRDTGKGNPLKIHQAKYVAPKASDGFFGGDAAAAPAAQPQATQVDPAPPATQQPSAPVVQEQPAQPAAAAPSDPWGTPAPAAGSGPPF
jgi:hypothetical protein